MGESKKTKGGRPKVEPEEEQVVECTECGYKGAESEFLKRDARDTKCPQCGADECTYLL